MNNRLAARVAAVVLAGVALQLMLPHVSERAGLIACCLPIGVAGWYAWVGFRRQARAQRGRQRLGLHFGAIAGALLGTSYLLYTADAVIGSRSLVDGAADAFGTAAALMAMPAVLVAVPSFPNRIARATYAIDVTTVAGAIFATAWQLVLAQVFVGLHPGERGVFVLTILPEVIAAALALMLMSRPAAGRYHSMRTLAGGMGAFALAAIISVHNRTEGLTWYANGLGAVYLIAGLAIGLVSQSAVAPEDNAADGEPTGSWSILPYLPVAVALSSVAVPYAHTGVLNPVLIWTLLGTSVLAMARQFLNLLAVKALVTDLEEQRHRLDHLAHHDTLTGLPNRAAFYTGARAVLARAAPDTITAVMVLDLDGFKKVNDTQGHAAGDTLLIQAGERIGAALRQGDTVARLGGDEFVILVPEVTGLDDAVAAGDRILEQLAAPMLVAGVTMRVKGSIGVSVAVGPRDDLDQILADADRALYQAKDAGKGVVRCFEPAGRG
ncbi:GGDEF domain-containing protein [Actinoplanes awajinensis]|uniref:GGDEF domain-containing protein n=1 Tax=Actinoplanes awajinensis TaxID=135946 RepID=UPI000AB9B300|nr:GGDEF domain-containing protein [Actinoplanes awajinensis]